MSIWAIFFFFFFNDTATTEIYTLSLHDALPICAGRVRRSRPRCDESGPRRRRRRRSEEHTSELQSQSNLVCRLLLEKKKKNSNSICAAPDCERSLVFDVSMPRRWMLWQI